MSQDFFEKYKNEIIRIINVSMVLFALLVGANIGSGSRDQEINFLKTQIKELNEFIEVTNLTFETQKEEEKKRCEQATKNAILIEKLEKENVFKDCKSICYHTKCDK